MALAVTLGMVFLWGLLAPRSQWRMLSSWRVADPLEFEPGSVAYGIRRLFFGLGLASMAAIAIGSGVDYVAHLPPPPTPHTSLEKMWGLPDPYLVDRVVSPLTSPPADMVDQPILDYQSWDADQTPSYLRTMTPFTRVATPVINGYIGHPPDRGLTGADTADLVVHVRGNVLCVPRAAVVTETANTVKVGIYYALPVPTDGSAIDSATTCARSQTATVSLLIPIGLQAPVGKRTVQSLDGTPLVAVRLVR